MEVFSLIGEGDSLPNNARHFYSNRFSLLRYILWQCDTVYRAGITLIRSKVILSKNLIKVEGIWGEKTSWKLNFRTNFSIRSIDSCCPATESEESVQRTIFSIYRMLPTFNHPRLYTVYIHLIFSPETFFSNEYNSYWLKKSLGNNM